MGILFPNLKSDDDGIKEIAETAFVGCYRSFDKDYDD